MRRRRAGPGRLADGAPSPRREVRTALGTADEASEGTTGYTANGQVEWIKDGENNKTSYEYDGHDRLSKTYYPSPTKGAGTSNGSDYEQFTYESLAGGTRTSGLVASFRNRANETIGFGYDALGRTTSKDRPGAEPDARYSYDLLGRMTSASQPDNSLTFAYDALGRLLSETRASGSYSSQYDLAGRRTRLTHPDGFYVDQDYLVTGEMSAIREYGATSGVGVLAAFAYDDLGRRSSLTYGNGASTSYQYDPVSRLSQLGLDLSGTANDLTLTYAYNPASQISSTTRSNDLYSWTGHGSGTTSTTSNGLNQLASWNGTLSHDSKGNITSDGTRSYNYDSENRMIGAAPYRYDALGRLYGAGTPLAIAYEDEGDRQTAERNPSTGATLRRHVFGPGANEPLVWYEGSGTASRRFLHADERGSTVAATESSGALHTTVRYDEYGATQINTSIAVPRFLYTGQRYFGGGGLYYYKARFYDPKLGRFLQPDPIGYGDGMNMYAYVGGDPVNFTDPSGLCGVGEVSVARNRTSRGEADPGDVVGLYRFFCMRLVLEEGAGGGGGVGNGAGAGTPAEKVNCKLGNGAIDVSFDGSTLSITATINLVGPGAETSGAYIGGIGKAWTRSFGHINSVANISAGIGGVTANISSGRFPPGGPRSALGGNQMWLGNLGAMPDWQKPFAINHVGPHEFGHSLKINNMQAQGKWVGSIMANSANNVSATDLEAVVEACRAAE